MTGSAFTTCFTSAFHICDVAAIMASAGGLNFDLPGGPPVVPVPSMTLPIGQGGAARLPGPRPGLLPRAREHRVRKDSMR